MKPIFSREAVVDRRQPAIRWGAVLAGSALALGLWNLFNLLFIGGALTAIDPDEIDRANAYGIGTGIGSVLAPLIAMFVGGLVAGRLSSHYDRRVSAGHGALVWAITSVLGLVFMASVIGNLVDKRGVSAHAAAVEPIAPGTGAFVDDSVRMINQHLKSVSAPTISKTDFLDASRYAAGDGRGINKDAFVSRLDANTDLSRPEAEAVLTKLGDTAPDVIIAGQQLALHRQQAMEAAETTGNALLAAGVGLFLCLATSIAGAIIGSGMRRRDGRPEAIAHHHHTTAPYPVPPGPIPAGGTAISDDANVGINPDTRRDPLE